MEDEHEMASALHARRKKSSIKRLSSCFSPPHNRGGSFDYISSILPSPGKRSPGRKSPSSWIKSKTQELPEIKGKCKSFIRGKGRRRHNSADFSYDPLSYSLNFEDDEPSDQLESPAMNFSSRLPASPPRASIVASAPSPGKTLSVSRGISSPLPASRAAAVAEVVKNLEHSPSQIRRNSTDQHLHTPRRPSSEVSRKSGDQLTRRAESLETAPAEESRSIDQRSTPRAAAKAEVRRSLEGDVTPSRRRQVLVELC